MASRPNAEPRRPWGRGARRRRARPARRDIKLAGRYIERREHHEQPSVLDLLAAAAEFDDAAADELRTVLAFYEAMRAGEIAAR